MNYERMTKEELVQELKRLQKALQFRKEDVDRSNRPLHELKVHQIELEMQNRELRESQQGLEEARDKYADLYDFAPIGYVSLDEKGIILEINLTGAEMLGFERTRLVGNPFLSFVFQEDVKMFLDHLRQSLRANQKVSTELRLQPKKGQLIHVQLLSTHDEKHFLRTAITNITDRKEAEEKETTLIQHIQAQKMEAVGTLAGGIAHDFNNLITGIMGNASLAKELVSPKDRVYKYLVNLENASLKARDLTQQLLTFSRGGAPVKKTASLGEMIKDSVQFVLRGSSVQPDFSLAEDLWPVEADVGQMNQVLNNLVINAVQAMPRGGTLTVRAEKFLIQEESLLPLRKGNYLKITIKDTGFGIPKQQLENIFEPYFTTKQGGHGLGLATAYAIIKKHGGLLTAASKKGFGTTFSIYLPATEKKYFPKRGEIKKAIPGKGKILVMDDEQIVRDIAGSMLMQLGYEVKFARDGKEAIAVYKESRALGQPFNALIIDLTIPGGMGGMETISRLLRIDPQVKAIVSSGYSADAVMADFMKHGFRAVITKPYRLVDLSQVVHQVLL